MLSFISSRIIIDNYYTLIDNYDTSGYCNLELILSTAVKGI